MYSSPFSKPINDVAPNSQYSCNQMNAVYGVERAMASNQYSSAMNATQTGVIPIQGFQQRVLNNNNTGRPQDQVAMARAGVSNIIIEPEQSIITNSLTGIPMKTQDFTHNNMVPFFRGESKQNVDRDGNRNIMENFTGSSDVYRNKTETKSFFDVKDNVGFVNGMPTFTGLNDIKSRYIPSDKRQGESPIEKINVGPGIAAGYVATPSGGLNQANARDLVMPKDTNDLRAANKPKLTYEARTINGLKSGQRGIVATPKKYRPDTYYNNNQERYFKNGSDIKAPAIREKFCFPANGRMVQRSYYGGAGQGQNLKPYKVPAIKKSTKHNYMNPVPRNGYRGDAWRLSPCNEKYVGDYGRNAIENKPNEREKTETRTILNNITTTVKKIIAPFQDIFRKTRNENFIGNNRPDGNFKAAMPSKPTMHDPEDVARTTLKETAIHNEHDGFLAGHVKNTVYDPEDVARTTIKETAIHNDHEGFLGGNAKHTVYDPNDIARTTIKETNIDNEAPYINMKPQKPTNIKIYDPEDIARTTVKELTLDNDHMGFISKPEKTNAGSYTSNRYNMKNTNKQFTSDYEYYGVADGDVGKGGGRGYLASRYNAKNTHKQFLSNYEYTGNAGQSQYERPMSYSDAYNARLNPNKEKIAIGREPTQEGAKVVAGEDLVNLQFKKIEGDYINLREPMETRGYDVPPQKNDCGLTIVRNTLPEQPIRDRIDGDILDAFKKNPYTQSLASAV